MKSILFVSLIVFAVSYSAGAQIKKWSCPTPSKPKVENWYFENFLGPWYVLARTDVTVPKTVYNTIEIEHFYPGKVAVLSRGDTRNIWVKSQWDKQIELTIGDFNGKSFYDLEDPHGAYFFNITTSDGHKGTFWAAYYGAPYFAEAVFISCAQIDEKTIDAKAWFVSQTKNVRPSKEVTDLVKSLVGQNLTKVCQGDFC